MSVYVREAGEKEQEQQYICAELEDVGDLEGTQQEALATQNL